MSKIKLLQLKKLLKELEYIESDFEYRSELISEADNEFIKSINNFLDIHPDIKDIYDKKINEKIDQSIKKNQESNPITELEITEDVEEETIYESVIDNMVTDLVETNVKLKKLYREIVKLTHPDKIKNERLNEIYLKATKYYDEINKIGIYADCNELSIVYEIETEDISLIYDEIQKYQQKINFIESTYTWKWFNCENDEQKDQILLNYIKLKIR